MHCIDTHSREDIVHFSSDLCKIHRQLFMLFNSTNKGAVYFPVEKLDHASMFIVSQREVLKRLKKNPTQVSIHNEHPVVRFLNFHDESSFRIAAFELRREFFDFAMQMKALNKICSAVHMPADQFDLYSLNVYAKPNRNIGMPFRSWRIGDYLSVTASRSGNTYTPSFNKKLRAKTRDVEMSSYVVEHGFGDLLSVFAEFGKVCKMVRGNLIHRTLAIYQSRQKNNNTTVTRNIERIEPVMNFIIPIFLEYANMMLDVRHAVVSNKPWKQPKFAY